METTDKIIVTEPCRYHFVIAKLAKTGRKEGRQDIGGGEGKAGMERGREGLEEERKGWEGREEVRSHCEFEIELIPFLHLEIKIMPATRGRNSMAPSQEQSPLVPGGWGGHRDTRGHCWRWGARLRKPLSPAFPSPSCLSPGHGDTTADASAGTLGRDIHGKVEGRKLRPMSGRARGRKGLGPSVAGLSPQPGSTYLQTPSAWERN